MPLAFKKVLLCDKRLCKRGSGFVERSEIPNEASGRRSFHGSVSIAAVAGPFNSSLLINTFHLLQKLHPRFYFFPISLQPKLFQHWQDKTLSIK
jgi:hypothetical protein